MWRSTGPPASTYEPTDSGDVGQGASSVRVTFTDDAGNDESLTSGATAEVEARPNRPADRTADRSAARPR